MKQTNLRLVAMLLLCYVAMLCGNLRASDWVNEELSESHNYYIYNTVGGFVGSNGNDVYLRNYADAELFNIVQNNSVYIFYNLNKNNYAVKTDIGVINSNILYASSGDKFNISKESRAGIPEYKISHKLALTVRYWTASAVNQKVSFGTSTSNHTWKFISEKQYEYRPKLDALVAFMERKTEKSEALNTAIAAAEALQSQTSLENPDDMINRCTDMINAAYETTDNHYVLYHLIKDASFSAAKLKQIYGQTPTNIKTAIGNAFNALLGESGSIDYQLDANNSNSLRAVYSSYMTSSVNAFVDVLNAAKTDLGYNITADDQAKLDAANSQQTYNDAAISIRNSFKNWVATRNTKGKGFPKNSKISLLVDNNSFEMGSAEGWTIDPEGIWFYSDADRTKLIDKSQYPLSESAWTSGSYAHVIDGDAAGITGRSGKHLFQSYRGVQTTDGSKNIHWGYNIRQTVTGLMPGTYKLTAKAGLLKSLSSLGSDKNFFCYSSSEKGYTKKVFINAKVNDGNLITAEQSYSEYDVLSEIALEFTVTSISDNVEISICGSTNELDKVGSYYAKYYVPFYVDDVQITLLSGAAACYTFDETEEIANDMRYLVGKEYEKVTVKRQLKTSDTWNTLCLPFAADKSQFSEVRELTSIVEKDNSAVLKFTTAQSVKAGKCYLVKVKTNSEIAKFEANDVSIVDPESTTVIDANNQIAVSFVGTYDKMMANQLPAGSFILQQNSFFQVDDMDDDKKSKTRIKGFRGYFNVETLSQSAPTLRLNDMDEEDENGSDIEAIVENEADARIYNMCGQRLNAAPASGIYFVNGKKYIKK